VENSPNGADALADSLSVGVLMHPIKTATTKRWYAQAKRTGE
jgi:hypothetical protein